MPDKKLLGAIAFTAALAGGGVAGLLLATPSVTAAQEADDGSTDDTTTEDSPTDDSTSERREGCGFHAKPNLGVAAEAIGISEDDLRAALEDGQSIAAVAETNGVDVQTVIDALVADATTRIDDAVAAGDLTAEEGEEREADLAERITEVVNREGLSRRGPHGPGRHGPPPAEGSEESDTEGS